MNKTLQAFYLDYVNNYLSLEKFAEHNMISIDLAALLVKEGRIHHELIVSGYKVLDAHNQNYLEIKMFG